MKVGVHKLPMNSPSDVSALERLIDRGAVNPAEIVALIGKTEGNGGANDFTRGFATLSYSLALAQAARRLAGRGREAHRLRLVGRHGGRAEPARDAVHARACRTADGKRLALGHRGDARFRARGSRHDGRGARSRRRGQARAGGGRHLRAADVHYVQVKGPLLTPAAVADADRRGAKLVTRDPNGSKPFARGATALGVALALGEVEEADLSDAVIAQRMDLFSSVANTSAGGELKNCEILLFGNSADGRRRSAHRPRRARDVIDAEAVRAAARDALGDPSAAVEPERIVAIFAKAEAPPNGLLRGRRTTMLSDADINYERHARAALGAVIASVTGDAAIFVSGGTEHQCEPGEAPIAAIVRV